MHSVDRLRLVRALGRAARGAGRVVELPGPGRAWTATRPAAARSAGEVPALADALAAEEALTLGGVMAVAPLAMAPADAFARLLASAAAVRAVSPAPR